MTWVQWLPLQHYFTEVLAALLISESLCQLVKAKALVDDGPDACRIDGIDHGKLHLLATDCDTFHLNEFEE